MRRNLCGLLVLISLFIAPQLGNAQDNRALLARASTVYIYFDVTDPSNGVNKKVIGTGFIVTKTGYVLTAAHLFRDWRLQRDVDRTRNVVMGSVRDKPGLVGEPPLNLTIVHIGDPDLEDVALLKLPDQLQYGFSPICMNKTYKPGDSFIAYGFPIDKSFQPVPGIFGTANAPGGRIFASSAFTYGMSGGPIYTSDGLVIGLVRGGLDGQDAVKWITPISFAAPLLLIAGYQDTCEVTTVGSLLPKELLVSSFTTEPKDDHDLNFLKIKTERNLVDYFLGKNVRVAHRSSTLNLETSSPVRIEGDIEREGSLVELSLRLVEGNRIVATSEATAKFETWRDNYKSIPEMMIARMQIIPETLTKRAAPQKLSDSATATLLFLEAIRLAEMQQLDRAAFLLHQAVKEDPHFAVAYWGLAQISSAQGNLDASAKWDEQASKIDPDHARPTIIGKLENPLPSLMAALQATDWKELNATLRYREIYVPAYKIGLLAWAFNPTHFVIDTVKSPSETGATIRELRTLSGAVLAINGGFFDIDPQSRMTPAGLLISNKRVIAKPSPKQKAGTGVVYESSKDGLNIDFVDSFTVSDNIIAALQVGPLLVDPGGKNGILRNDLDRQSRSVVCLDRVSQIVIVVITGGLSLFEAGEILAARRQDGGFDCDRALNLDGGPSTSVSFSFAEKATDIAGRWKVADALIVKLRK